MTILMMITMTLMVIMMMKPDDYDDDTDDDHHHKNDSYTAAGAALGAGVPCSLLQNKRNNTKETQEKEQNKTQVANIHEFSNLDNPG